jgi:hypothetical protein
MKHVSRALPFIAGMVFSLLAAVLVAGIWHVGDAQCEAAKREEVLAGYGYPITVDPCADAWVGEWLAPAW